MAVVSLYVIWQQPGRPERNVALLLVAVGALIGLAIEVVFLRDNFQMRMNTLFKFYFQLWILFALAAGYGLWKTLYTAFGERNQDARTGAVVYETSPVARALSVVWAGALVLLVLSGCMYSVYGVKARQIGNQTATTSPVVNVQAIPDRPGWYYADTQSGSRYVGHLLNQQRTVYDAYQATQYVPQPQCIAQPPVNPREENPLIPQSSYPGVTSFPPGLNWGAFLMAPWWGIAHNVWIALLAFLPPAALVMQIVLLIKGNEWGWQNRRFSSVQEFYEVQKKWLIAGIIFGVIGLLLNFCLFFLMIPLLMAI
jgi:hypothetical protein